MIGAPICTHCRRELVAGASSCAHCGKAVESESSTGNTGCAILGVAGIILLVMFLSRPAASRHAESAPVTATADDTPDLAGPGPFTLRANHVACISAEALERSDALLGDARALARFLLESSNGCVPTTGGLRVYAVRAAYHVQRIHPVGDPSIAYVHNAALAK